MNIEYIEESHHNLLMSGETPRKVSFPKIFDMSTGGMDPIGGFVELERFTRPTFDFETLKGVVQVMTRKSKQYN